MEWWGKGKRKITIYIGEETIEYLKVWGTHIISDMSDSVYETGELPELIRWLCEENYD